MELWRHLTDPKTDLKITKDTIWVLKKKNLDFFSGKLRFFFLGGKDSCKGDSGGPIYTWYNGKVISASLDKKGRQAKNECCRNICSWTFYFTTPASKIRKTKPKSQFLKIRRTNSPWTIRFLD